MHETHLYLEYGKTPDCDNDFQTATYQHRRAPGESSSADDSSSGSASRKKRRSEEDDNSSLYEHDDVKLYEDAKLDMTDTGINDTSAQSNLEDDNQIGADKKSKRSHYRFKRAMNEFFYFYSPWGGFPGTEETPQPTAAPVETEATSDSVTCQETVFHVCLSSDDSPVLTEEQEEKIRVNYCGLFLTADDLTEECGPDEICRIIHDCEKWRQFDASPYYVSGSSTIGAGGGAGRRRRRSVSKRQTTNPDHDIDMCCPTRTRWISNDTMVNINGDTRTVVHLRSIGQYQFVPHGRCAGVDELCSGVCQQENVVQYILVWIGFQLRFDAFEIPVYCSCKNVGVGRK